MSSSHPPVRSGRDVRARAVRVGMPWPAGWRRWWPLGVELGVLALALLAAAHVIYLTRFGGSVPNGDVAEYREYALDFWTRLPLFHHLPVEYPPLAILPFTLTLLPPLSDPLIVFEWWMGAAVMLSYLWLRRFVSREMAITYAAYLLLGAASTVLARFDLFPALATLLALWAAQRRRFTAAYILLAAGILLKLYPAFLVPLVAIEQWRVLRAQQMAVERQHGRRHLSLIALPTWSELRPVARGLGLCAGAVVLGFGVAALLSPSGVLSGFTYAGSRPLQVESTPATLLWLGTLAGIPAHTVYSYQSLNYVGPLDAVLKPLSALALAAGCLYVYWRQLGRHLDVGRAFVACLCVIIVTNKIFSPQYIIWILPLVAYVEGLDLLWVAIGLFTTLIYPFVYFAHPHILLVIQDWRFWPAITLRNALLLLVTARALWTKPAGAISPAGPFPRPLLARGRDQHDRAAGKVPVGIRGS